MIMLKCSLISLAICLLVLNVSANENSNFGKRSQRLQTLSRQVGARMLAAQAPQLTPEQVQQLHQFANQQQQPVQQQQQFQQPQQQSVQQQQMFQQPQQQSVQQQQQFQQPQQQSVQQQQMFQQPQQQSNQVFRMDNSMNVMDTSSSMMGSNQFGQARVAPVQQTFTTTPATLTTSSSGQQLQQQLLDQQILTQKLQEQLKSLLQQQQKIAVAASSNLPPQVAAQQQIQQTVQLQQQAQQIQMKQQEDKLKQKINAQQQQQQAIAAQQNQLAQLQQSSQQRISAQQQLIQPAHKVPQQVQPLIQSVQDTSAVPFGVGTTVSNSVGTFGNNLQTNFGTGVGTSVGTTFGSGVQSTLGTGVGTSVGSGVASTVNSGLGSVVGSGVGSSVGSGLGTVGSSVGSFFGGLTGNVSIPISTQIRQPLLASQVVPPTRTFSNGVSDDICASAQSGELLSHPTDPTQFIICYGFGEFNIMECPDHTVFNPHLKRCDLNTDVPLLCNSNPCLNGGKCVEVSSTKYKCECKLGFGGPECEKLDTCSTKPCGQDGVCLSFALGSPIAHVCLCNGGRSVGLSCDKAEPNPCLLPGSQTKVMGVNFNRAVFAHCEGSRPHFKFCQPPLEFSITKQACEWS